MNELNALSPLLAGLEFRNPYSVPAGYFEGLAGDLLLAVQGNEKESVNLSKTETYRVPEGYFDALPQQILSRIRNEEQTVAGELTTLSPLLAGIQKVNPYQVPEGYFNRNETELIRNIAPVKVVSMNRTRRWLRYAAAAVVTGALALGAYTIFGTSGTKNGNNETASLLNDSAGKMAMTQGLDIASKGTFDEELDKVSDDDIVNYLKNDGQELDAGLVASAINDKDLPKAEDYLLDEETLDKFLNTTNTKSELKN